jgi:hypothetical protein
MAGDVVDHELHHCRLKRRQRQRLVVAALKSGSQ